MRLGLVLLLFVIYAVGTEQPAYSYIDPATGSMLFSVLLGIITTLFFVIQTVFYKLRLLVNKKDLSKDTIPITIYSEGKKYDNLFIPILDELEQRQTPVTFFTSSEDDSAFSKNYKYVDCKYIGEGNKAFFKLAFLKADVCLMTTPGLDVLQLKRSKYVKHYAFTPHEISDLCGYRLFSLDYYDSVLLTCDINKQYIREIESKRNILKKELITVGCPQMDLMKSNLSKYLEYRKEKFCVLFSPTWGPSSLAARMGEQILDILSKKTDWDIIFRPHPQSLIVEKDIIKKFCEKYNNTNIRFDFDPNNMKSLSAADIMITDFSGIIFEFSFLFEKPVLYSTENKNEAIYEASWLDKPTWKNDILKSIGEEITTENVSYLINMIEKASSKTDEIKKAKEILWQNQNNGAKSIADFLINKQKEVSAK